MIDLRFMHILLLSYFYAAQYRWFVLKNERKTKMYGEVTEYHILLFCEAKQNNHLYSENGTI